MRRQNEVVLEIFASSGPVARTASCLCLNNIMHSGDFPSGWCNLMCVKMPGSGDMTDPSNWRSLTIFDVCCKIFARVLYARLVRILEPHKSMDQMGFRPKLSIIGALIVMEAVVASEKPSTGLNTTACWKHPRRNIYRTCTWHC